MGVITNVLFSTLGFCVLALFLLHGSKDLESPKDFNEDPTETFFLTMPQELTPELPKNEPKVYAFNNAKLANKVLSQLDVFKSAVGIKGQEKTSPSAFLGMKKKENYCDRHRAYVIEHPDMIFNEMNFFIEESPGSFTRSKVLRPIGNDIHPKIGSQISKTQKEMELFDLKNSVNIFFTKNDMHVYMEMGKHFGCITQEYNHIPGHSGLARKDLVAKSVIKYAATFKDQPQCFNYEKFFPRTWLLYESDQCKEFFKNLNSQAYQKLKEERRIVYIRKIGSTASHRGEGVQPVNDFEEEELRRDYDNGKKCGQVTKNYLVQNYVHNPLLLDGHKFDFRMYMLIASTNPLMAFYHDGFLRVTLASYDVNSDEKKVLLTNLALNQQIYDDVKEGRLYEGMDEESLKRAQQWSFDRLQTHLLEKGVISDPDWLDNYLRPEFKKAMIHLLRAGSDTFLKRSPVYELYGVDFMLDENLNLWFIEANSSPAFKGYSIPMEKFILKMLGDHFEIVTGLLKSRMKRIVEYVNDLIDDGIVQEGKRGKILISNLESRREVFDDITKNYFEDEFEPKPTNGFSKIIDENYRGIQRYRGLVDKECI